MTDLSPSDPQLPGPDRAAPPASKPKPKRTFRVWLSYLLFAVSAVLFVVVLVMYIRGRNDDDVPAAPTVEAGSNTLYQVREALKANGLNADFGKGADRAVGVTEVAQTIDIDGQTIYVFIYPDPDQRQRDQDALGDTSLVIINTRGTPVAENPPYIVGGSNVLVAVYSDDESLREKVQTAIEGLP